MKNSMEVPQKTKNRITIWYSNSTPGYISRKNKNTNLKRYMNLNVHSSTIYNRQDKEATQVFSNRWMDKKEVIFYVYLYTWNIIYIYTCIYISYIWIYSLLNCKRKEILSLAATWMGLQNIIFNEISQRKTSLNCTISFICGI